jgi:lipoate-protein ligase A
VFYYLCRPQAENPVLNLALEEWLFQTIPAGDVLFLLYSNHPAVVWGKNQNPWKEANIPWLKEKKIPGLRRISGGGTVWHDPGNLNYSFIGDRHLCFKEQNLAFLADSLKELGITVEVNERGDLLLQGKKCSGNALAYARHTILHHGTLLVDADLPTLHLAIDTSWHEPYSFSSTGVTSVRSQVTQLKGHNTLLTTDLLAKHLVSHWIRLTQAQPWNLPLVFTKNIPPHILQKYQDWDWNFGRTPDFECQSGPQSHIVEKGRIEGLEFDIWCTRGNSGQIAP